MTLRTVSPEEMYQLSRQGAPIDFIDVRTPAEYHEIHASGTRLVPLDQFDPDVVRSSRVAPAGYPLYIISRSHHRARRACRLLQGTGISDVVLVDGGMQAWQQAGLPVRRGDTILGLESQVNIAVGLLIVIGAALGTLIASYFLVLALVGGVALIYDNLTDSFSVGTLLARLPWNRESEP